jgi:tetratricopeptide (TPR) repeat protein
MIGLLVVMFALLVLHRQLIALESGAAPVLAPRRSSAQLAQLSSYADRLYGERKWLAAEKAYLSVLKLDHKNVTAYVHLGIIYSTQKNMPDAIECFGIAVRLRPSGSTYQNLALAFYDNRNYIKSIAAYEKALMFEPTAQRYVGLGKTQLKLHNLPAATTAFENAVSIDPSKRVLQRLAEAYELSDRKTDAIATYRRIYELDPSDQSAARHIGIHLPDSTVKR